MAKNTNSMTATTTRLVFVLSFVTISFLLFQEVSSFQTIPSVVYPTITTTKVSQNGGAVNNRILPPATSAKSSSLSSLSSPNNDQMSRRNVFSTSIASAFAAFVIAPKSAQAFPNKISDKYDDRPKRRGPQPKDLGILTRKNMAGEEYLGLKPCGPAPNCFCSTDEIEEDPEHNIPPWKWPADKFGTDKTAAFRELEAVMNEYKPGQGNIDGGGFAVVKSDVEKGYIYAQFESLKAGYIDDFEVAYIAGTGTDNNNAVQVRSSSRVGYLDFGVNAKRINYLAKALRGKGWDAPGVDFDKHQDYFIQNSAS